VEAERYLTELEAAAILQVKPRRLRWWRERGVGPPYVRFGRLVRYRESALLAWLKSQETEPT